MDNIALEITVAALWTLAVFVLPLLTVFIGGFINVYSLGNRATAQGGKGFLDTEDPGKFVSDAAKKGFLIMLACVVIALVLAGLSLWQAIEAWVAVAS